MCLRIGLTGGIASGKSTVAQRFQELGTPVIDADEIARQVVAPGSPGLAEVVRTFGAGVLRPDGELDRTALRRLVFADPARRRALELILHPLIKTEMEHRARQADGPYVVMAIPLLVEGRGRAGFDRVLVVDVDEGVQLARVMARDGGTREEALAILAAQTSRDRRLALADDVIENGGTLADVRDAVDRLHQRYLEAATERAAARSEHLT